MPSRKDILDIDKLMSCESLNMSSELDYTTITLDSSSEFIAAGNIYMVVIPDYTNYTGDKSRVSSCYTLFSLNINE